MDTTLVVFFSYGVSVREWIESGLFSREVEIYDRLAKIGVKTIFVTYGNETDNDYLQNYPDLRALPLYSRIKPSSSRWLTVAQSFLIPILFRKELASASLFKTNQVWGSWAAVAAKWMLGKKLIVRGGYEPYTFLRDSGASSIKRITMYVVCRVVYHSADIVEMATEEDRRTLQVRFGLTRRQIRVEPNVIDTCAFRPVNCVRGDVDRVLMVGRLDRQKNYKLALQALSGTNLSVTIVGDGTCRGEVETLADQLEVKVEFLGRVNNRALAEIYRNHSIYVMSSLFEGNPKTLLEAMSTGLAVVGTDVPGINNLIRNRQNGLLTPLKPESLRNAILELTDSGELRRRLGSEARKFVVANNSLDSRVLREREFLDSFERS